ncbi:DUF2336 domain-containing protein [Jiella pacifica]|uniref:DUF2336 domain-containing protein n=1 Tax=Jiella pacifica TaxID=2696469 RepID=A0A6N9SVM4_9HYPH|nr:DUF2336 domain-containing protein [Jiella pacifica]NDW03054.1 hypothetical protein [Jiella pacifica]
MPRIFRTLETRGGQVGFDTIVEAAVASFLASNRPSPAHTADFARLVTSTWAKLSLEAKRQLAISLATSPHVPRSVVDLLLVEPAEVSAPFLFSSPCLTKDDARTIGATPDAAPAPGPRQHGPGPALPVRTPRPQGRSHSLADAAAQPPLQSAAAARDALRALVRAKPRRPLPASSSSPNTPPVGASRALGVEGTAAALLREARAGRPDRALTLIASSLKLPAATVETFAMDGDGTPLAAALKLLGLTVADAMTVMMMVHRTAGCDVAAFAQLRRHYEDLSIERSAAALGVSDVPALAASRIPPQAEHQPLYAPEAQRRPATAGQQTVFGRRRKMPSAIVSRNGR